MTNPTDFYDVPTEREFATTLLMTGFAMLVISVVIAVTATWFAANDLPSDRHMEAIRTAVVIPLIIVPLCVGIVSFQAVRIHRRLITLSKLAHTDEMTGLANRRAFMRTANTHFEQSNFDYSGLALMIVDLDHFKRVNDQYGHDAGDEVLKNAAQQIKVACSEDCLVARLGGEEFAVMMPYDSVAGLHRGAEAIRARVAATPCEYQGKTIRVSASLGVGIAHARDTVSSVLSRADNALYDAKDDGRNQYKVAA